MKAAQSAILAIVIFALMSWSRGQYSFRLPITLPLLGGKDPSFYDLVGAMMIVIAVVGLMRLSRQHHNRQ